MSEEKKKLMDAIELLEEAFNNEIEHEREQASNIAIENGRSQHNERMLDYSQGKRGLLKLKAKLLQKNG